jgi:hypothetical protein
VIRLGDWIDLEGGLTVEDHNAGGGGFSSGDEGMHWNANITLNGADKGKMCGLIVVGINPFKDLNGNGGTPHVVFQFQNIPVLRRMNPTASNAGGYPESEMRVYLTGEFLSGLKDAGVPEGVLWGPSRVVSGKENGAKTINDTLWLPTEREMFGSRLWSVEPMKRQGIRRGFRIMPTPPPALKFTRRILTIRLCRRLLAGGIGKGPPIPVLRPPSALSTSLVLPTTTSLVQWAAAPSHSVSSRPASAGLLDDPDWARLVRAAKLLCSFASGVWIHARRDQQPRSEGRGMLFSRGG